MANLMKNTRTNNSLPYTSVAQTGVPGAKSTIPANKKSVFARVSGTPAEERGPKTNGRSRF